MTEGGRCSRCCCRRRAKVRSYDDDDGETTDTSVVPTGDGSPRADMSPTKSESLPKERRSSTASERSVGNGKDQGGRSNKGAKGKPFPKRPMGCKLSQTCWDKLEEVFRQMDPDGSNAVTKEEARVFFKGAFGKMSADAMFNEVDVDGSGAIDADEFISFWVAVRKSGYKEQDICDELDELLEGGAWVDWKDGRDTGASKAHAFPKRPMLCRLSAQCWAKAGELFEKLDHNKEHIITMDKALKHFKGGFSKVSAEAMFNEIDVNHHGQITAKEFMKFWVQVKSAGYKNQDILDELQNLIEGEQWVDWKDGRSTA